MDEQLTLDEVNGLTDAEFISKFSGIVEHTEEAAAAVQLRRPLLSINQLISSFHQYLDALSLQGKTAVLEKHPELGAKVVMSQYSVDEQKASGVSSLPSDLSRQLATLNKQYRDKFGFPFVICVKENSAETILRSVESRLDNTLEQEIHTGIQQVKKIAEIRISQVVKH